MLIIIDNYDSFTYNLRHFLGELGAQSEVCRNDVISAGEVIARRPRAIVLSPGPCGPDEAGICLELTIRAEKEHVPLLGVCLGHEVIGQAFGGKVVRAPRPVHGWTSQIFHDQKGVFAGLQDGFAATRYHSLILDEDSVPETLEISARTQDGLIMGVRHKTAPIYGVQFHPESIATDHGHDVLANFLRLAGEQRDA